MRVLLAACMLALAAPALASAEIGGAIQPPPLTDIIWTPTETRTAWGGEAFAREFNQLPDRKTQLAYIAYLAAAAGGPQPVDGPVIVMERGGRAKSPAKWLAAQRRSRGRRGPPR